MLIIRLWQVFAEATGCCFGEYGNRFFERSEDKRKVLFIPGGEGKLLRFGDIFSPVLVFAKVKVHGKAGSIYDRSTSPPLYLR